MPGIHGDVGFCDSLGRGNVPCYFRHIDSWHFWYAFVVFLCVNGEGGLVATLNDETFGVFTTSTTMMLLNTHL